MATFGVMCDGGKVCVLVIPTPVTEVKCEPNGTLERS
jgi:hypothetical protein